MEVVPPDVIEYDEDGRPAFTEQVTSNPEGMTSSLAMNVYTL